MSVSYLSHSPDPLCLQSQVTSSVARFRSLTRHPDSRMSSSASGPSGLPPRTRAGARPWARSLRPGRLRDPLHSRTESRRPPGLLVAKMSVWREAMPPGCPSARRRERSSGALPGMQPAQLASGRWQLEVLRARRRRGRDHEENFSTELRSHGAQDSAHALSGGGAVDAKRHGEEGGLTGGSLAGLLNRAGCGVEVVAEVALHKAQRGVADADEQARGCLRWRELRDAGEALVGWGGASGVYPGLSALGMGQVAGPVAGGRGQGCCGGALRRFGGGVGFARLLRLLARRICGGDGAITGHGQESAEEKRSHNRMARVARGVVRRRFGLRVTHDVLHGQRWWIAAGSTSSKSTNSGR